MLQLLTGFLIPFAGTSAGAACVFFMRRQAGARTGKALNGFAAGVMAASTVWSLLIPALEQSGAMGRLRFLPSAAGFWVGVGFMLLLNKLVMRADARAAGDASGSVQMMLAVVLHNIPEGMAVGVAYAGLRAGNAGVTAASAFALALGIAIQNFPEGAIISLPLRSRGVARWKAFAGGVLSGAVEPVAALAAYASFSLCVPALPYVLSFAAGAMIFVVVGELIPEICADGETETGTLCFCIGATLMMIADVAAGQ